MTRRLNLMMYERCCIGIRCPVFSLTLPKAETTVVAEAQQADALEDNWSSRQEANDVSPLHA